MGNRFGRRRDTPATGGESATTEEKTAEEPVAPQPGEDIETEKLDVVVGEPVASKVCLPSEECISECKVTDAPAASATRNDAEPEPVAEETAAPVQLEPLVSISEPSPEPGEEPTPAAEAQLAPEPAPDPVPEPELTSNPEAEVVAESISESVPEPGEALEQQTDMLTQESLPEPALSSPAVIDQDVTNVTPQPANNLPSPAPVPDPVDGDEPSDIPVTEERQDNAEATTSEPEKSEEMSETPAEPTEVEAAGDLEQLVSDVTEDSISGLLQNLELKGNDLVADLIPDDVKIRDDTPITDVSTSTEQM